MKKPSQEDIVRVLLDSRPQSLAHLLGIPVEDASADSLFRLLCAALLYDDRVTDAMLVRAFDMFGRYHWTNMRNMSESTLAERINALEAADYVLFDDREYYGKVLGDAMDEITRSYGGDVRNIRKQAAERPEIEWHLISRLKGIGEKQAQLFFREVQTAWCENFPFVTKTAFNGARKLGLTDNVKELGSAVKALDFPRFVAALEQVEKTGNSEEILEKARLGRAPVAG